MRQPGRPYGNLPASVKRFSLRASLLPVESPGSRTVPAAVTKRPSMLLRSLRFMAPVPVPSFYHVAFPHFPFFEDGNQFLKRSTANTFDGSQDRAFLGPDERRVRSTPELQNFGLETWAMTEWSSVRGRERL